MDPGAAGRGASLRPGPSWLSRFLLDEDIPPRAAEIARGLGVDVLSVAEVHRLGWGDEDQLKAAAADGRIFVTCNRNDFIVLTRRFFEEHAPHCGVLIVPGSIPRRHPARLAHAIQRWAERQRAGGHSSTAYLCTFLDP